MKFIDIFFSCLIVLMTILMAGMFFKQPVVIEMMWGDSVNVTSTAPTAIRISITVAFKLLLRAVTMFMSGFPAIGMASASFREPLACSQPGLSGIPFPFISCFLSFICEKKFSHFRFRFRKPGIPGLFHFRFRFRFRKEKRPEDGNFKILNFGRNFVFFSKFLINFDKNPKILQ